MQRGRAARTLSAIGKAFFGRDEEHLKDSEKKAM